MYSLICAVPPTIEPVTVATAKSHLRVETNDEDALIGIYIKAAREHCEKQTNRAIIEQTWTLALDRFPSWLRSGPEACTFTPDWSAGFAIRLPMPKVLSVTQVTFIDTTGVDRTLDPPKYRLNASKDAATLSPAYGCSWPCALPTQGSVSVTYTAGYGSTADDVPASIQLAILLLVGHFYENREATQAALSGNGPLPLPIGVDALLTDEAVLEFTYES